MLRLTALAAAATLGFALAWLLRAQGAEATAAPAPRVPASESADAAPLAALQEAQVPSRAGSRAAVGPPARPAGNDLREAAAHSYAPALLPAELEVLPTLAELHVLLIDRATGLPVEGQIELFRLGIPADMVQTAGDVSTLSAFVGLDGVTIAGIHPGRHRVHVKSARPGFLDPPEFDLGAPLTRVVVPVDLPPCHPVSVRIVDERGRRVDPVSIARFSKGYKPIAPAWAALRHPHGEELAGDAALAPLLSWG